MKSHNPLWINWTALVVLLIIWSLVIISHNKAMEQEKLFLLDRQIYYTAMDSLNNQRYGETIDILNQTSPSFKQSWLYIYSIGLTQYLSAEFSLADENFQKAEDIRPAFLNNADFLIYRSDVFVKLGNREQALMYLEQAQKHADNETQTTQIQELIAKANSLP